MPINLTILEQIRGNSALNDTIWQLFRNGPTKDGDMVSKSDRSRCVDWGFIDRHNGYNFLTHSGVELALALHFDKRKEAERRI